MRKRKKKNKFFIIISLIIMICMLFVCKAYFVDQPKSLSDEKAITFEKKSDESKNGLINNNCDDLTVGLLSKYQFLNPLVDVNNYVIERNSFFHGYYINKKSDDVEMFYGHSEGNISSIKKIDQYTYSLEINECKVDSSEKYLIRDGDNIQIYLPGKPISEIDDYCLNILENDGNKIASIAMVNKSNQICYIGSTRKSSLDEANDYLNDTQVVYEKYGEQIESGITQDMIEATGNQYYVTDKCLNDIWSLVKNNVSKEKYDKILVEQRLWNETKEIKAESEAVDSGTMGTVIYNETLTDETMTRCEELLSYLNN